MHNIQGQLQLLLLLSSSLSNRTQGTTQYRKYTEQSNTQLTNQLIKKSHISSLES